MGGRARVPSADRLVAPDKKKELNKENWTGRMERDACREQTRPGWRLFLLVAKRTPTNNRTHSPPLHIFTGKINTFS